MKNSSENLPRVCVIGAGVAGLTAAKQLHQAGIPFDCFDRRDRTGGIWAYGEKKGETSVWHSLHMNSPRGTYEYSDYPMPAHYPDFPGHTQVYEYLNNYVDHFGFRQHIRLNTGVKQVVPLDNGTWQVTLDSGQVLAYDAVVVANGHHNEPNYPDFESHFAGRAIHSQDYRHREGYKDKRVLVVGFGNSASQIAVDVSYTARDTLLSTRRGGYLFLHYHQGKRIDQWFSPKMNYWMNKLLPWPLGGVMATFYYRRVLGDPAVFGLPKPDHYFGEGFPTISENLINRLGDGSIRIKPDIARFDGFEVTFQDGSKETVDEVIYCTGYHTTFPFLDEAVFAASDNRVGLYKRIFLPDRPNLCFVGAFQAMAWGFLPIMEVQARLVVKYLRGEYALPSREQMGRDIERESRMIARRFVHSLRHNYQMNGYIYMHECEVEMKRGYRRARKEGFALPVIPRTFPALARSA